MTDRISLPPGMRWQMQVTTTHCYPTYPYKPTHTRIQKLLFSVMLEILRDNSNVIYESNVILSYLTQLTIITHYNH
jgi:hypothetical protein